MYKEKLGERIRHIRKVLEKSTLVDFSKKIGVSNSFISESENGKTAPGAEVLFSICREFSINGHWLLTGEGTPRIESKPSAVAEPSSPYETTTPPAYTQYEIARTPEEIAKASKGNVKAVFDAGAPLRAMKTQLQKLEEENKLLRARLDQTDHILSLLHITILEKHKEEEHKKEKEPA